MIRSVEFASQFDGVFVCMPQSTNRLYELGAKGANLLVRFVFPATCAGCGAAGSWLCERCERDLVDISSSPVNAGTRAHSLDEALSDGAFGVDLRARFAFSGPARKAVHLLKYRGERARAEWFAEIMAPLVPGSDSGIALLVPVPLTARRERRRGYNQSEEIARRLAEFTGIQTAQVVKRMRETRPQVELSGIERLHNVRGAFEAVEFVRDRHVILIDDVVTTGATMRECGRACYLAGATSVVGVAGTAGLGR